MKPKKPKSGDSLGDKNPELAKQWHPTKNGSLTPYDIIPGTEKKVWWECPKGDDHEWEAQIRTRNLGIGCPICSNKKVVKSNCLATINPELAKEWHPYNNGELTPFDVTPGSHRKVWWQCSEGEDHEWMASLKDRYNGRGCAICAGKKVVKSNCLETLNPELVKQWHPAKNGDLTPRDVTVSSHKKVWWKCPEGEDHQWETKISDRKRGEGCPVCTNHKVVISNCLATINPKLANEWHPTKNIDITPYKITPGSHKKIWWKCPKGEDHEWCATVASRNSGGGCPVCLNKKVVKSNSLKTTNPELSKEWHPTKNYPLTPLNVTKGTNKKVWWQCSENSDHVWEAGIINRSNGVGCPICISLAKLNPLVSKEWHPTKNHPLTPLDVTPGSNKKVWWKCSKNNDHEWKAGIINRVKGSGCPKCNSLVTINPIVSKEWHPTKNNELTPFDVTPGSGKKVWWKCPVDDNHEWEATIHSRHNGIGCPICSNRKIILSNSLATLFPEISKEWHPTKNGDITPNDIAPRSGKKIWWQCAKNKDHVWHTTPDHRTGRGQECPYCKNPSSRPELRILSELRTIFPSTQHRIYLKGHEVDIFIPDLDIGIEYDGEYWHRNRIKQDLIKNDVLKDDIILIRLREKGLPLLSETDIEIKTRDLTINTMKKLLKAIKNHRQISNSLVDDKIQTYLTFKTWVAKKEFRKLHAARHHILFEKSLAYLYPEIAEQWHYEKNSPLLPSHYTTGSNKKVWWICPKNNSHIWESQIVNRVKAKGCPICAGRKITIDNCLATTNPELAKHWHPTKNGSLTPFDVGQGSSKKIWWKCPKGDDHEWLATVSSRNSGVGCPICSNYKVVKSNSLRTTNPELSKEWHPNKNHELTPDHVTSGSHKKVWWKCIKCSNEWQAVIKSRQFGRGCPKCADNNLRKTSISEIKKFAIKLGGKCHNTEYLNTKMKLKFSCEKGHQWEIRADRFFEKQSWCPICDKENPNQLTLWIKN